MAFLPIYQTEVKYYVGDSLTGGGPSTPYYTQFEADTASHVAPAVKIMTPPGIGATVTKATSGATTTAASLGGIAYRSSFVARGFPGFTIGQIANAEASWLPAAVSAGATIVIIEAGVNNVVNNTIADAAADSLALIADVHAALPAARVAFVNVFVYNEQYPAPTDAAVATVNAAIAATVATNNSFAYLFDVRTAQQAYEATNNVPAPGVSSGLLTIDGTHPNATGLSNMTTSMESQISYQ